MGGLRRVRVDDLRLELTKEQREAIQECHEKMQLWLYAELKADQWRHLCSTAARMRMWKDLAG